MKPSLRNKYFGWLLFLLLIVYGLIFLVLFAIEYHESHMQGTPFSDEYPELLAILGIMLFTLPATLIITWNVAGRLLQPLQKVLDTAELIRRGNLTERIPPLPHHDELAHLAESINDAFDRYASAVTRLENFSADASHQLRTPLAAIKTSAEVALRTECSQSEYQNTLSDILEQTDKLDLTIDQLIALARLDHYHINQFRTFQLDDLLKRWMQDVHELMLAHTITPVLEVSDPPSTVIGDPILLRQVFDNLINNAMEYTPSGGVLHVRLQTTPDGKHLNWTIEDSGPGIPAEERSRIFDRFYRGKQSGTHGSGLGLAIALQIIELHGGTIQAGTSDTLGGAAFSIRLPLTAIQAKPTLPAPMTNRPRQAA